MNTYSKTEGIIIITRFIIIITILLFVVFSVIRHSINQEREYKKIEYIHGKYIAKIE